MGKGKKLIDSSMESIILNKLNESIQHTNVVKRVLSDLVTNYSPMISNLDAGLGFNIDRGVEVKGTKETLTIKELFERLSLKYSHINAELIKQIIIDWFNGDIGNNLELTKNIPVS